MALGDVNQFTERGFLPCFDDTESQSRDSHAKFHAGEKNKGR
jgi:hypothetical protein